MKTSLRQMALVAVVAFASVWPCAASAFSSWTNTKGDVMVGFGEGPESAGCNTNSLCSWTTTINIGAGWTEVEAFIANLSMNGASAGEMISFFQVAAYKSTYNSGTGDLTVQYKARLNTPTTHSIGYNISFSFVATVATDGAHRIMKVPLSKTCTTAGPGGTASGCTMSTNDASTKGNNWPHLGHAIKEFSIEVKTGVKVDFSQIKLAANGTAITAGHTDTNLSFQCALTTDGSVVDEPLECKSDMIVLSADPSYALFSSGSKTLNWVNGVSNLQSDSYSLSATGITGPLIFLKSFDFTRDPNSGAEYGPVFHTNFGCQNVGYSSGTISATFNGSFLNQLSIPYLDYHGTTICNVSRIL